MRSRGRGVTQSAPCGLAGGALSGSGGWCSPWGIARTESRPRPCGSGCVPRASSDAESPGCMTCICRRAYPRAHAGAWSATTAGGRPWGTGRT
uniref:Putative secreted protein n=1 Tax=Ixodes ricinus TaxID=34613 RepID=A0A6B0U2M0_IXORI